MNDRAKNIMLDELAEDARRYLDLLEQLRKAPPGSDGYDDLDTELYLAITQLGIHGLNLQEVLDEAMMEEVEAQFVG